MDLSSRPSQPTCEASRLASGGTCCCRMSPSAHELSFRAESRNLLLGRAHQQVPRLCCMFCEHAASLGMTEYRLVEFVSVGKFYVRFLIQKTGENREAPSFFGPSCNHF